MLDMVRLTIIVRRSIALGCCFIGLALPVGANDGGKNVTITENDNGQSIALRKGDVLVVKLSAQLGTGFGWQLAGSNKNNLEPVGSTETESPEKPVPGAVQRQVFRFRWKAAGSSDLELHYRRPWEKNVAPARTFRLTVHAE